MTNTFKEIKEKLFGVSGVTQNKNPSEIAVQTLFSPDKHLQTGKITDDHHKLIAMWIGVNEIFFNIKLSGKENREFNKEMQKIYTTNNSIIEKYLLLTKSIDAEGILAIKTMFNEQYINNSTYNNGMPINEVKK